MGKIQPTYQQRLFSDSELGLIAHDDIVRWADLFIKSAPGRVLDNLGINYTENSAGLPTAWHLEPHVGIDSDYTLGSVPPKARKHLEAVARKTASEKPIAPLIKFSRPQWEPILKNDRGTMIGAGDLDFSFTIARLSLTATCSRLDVRQDEYLNKIVSEFRDDTLVSDGKQVFDGDHRNRLDLADLALKIGPAVIIDGSIVALTKCEWTSDSDYDRKNYRVLVEVKTKIRTIGELLRQINFYRSSASYSYYVVVAPAAELCGEKSNILREQGIFNLPYLSN